jgi:hypothetical protein
VNGLAFYFPAKNALYVNAPVFTSRTRKIPVLAFCVERFYNLSIPNGFEQEQQPGTQRQRSDRGVRLKVEKTLIPE